MTLGVQENKRTEREIKVLEEQNKRAEKELWESIKKNNSPSPKAKPPLDLSHDPSLDCSKPPRATEELDWWYVCHKEPTALKNLTGDHLRTILKYTVGGQRVTPEVLKRYSNDLVMQWALMDAQRMLDEKELIEQGQENVQRAGEQHMETEEEMMRRAQQHDPKSRESTITGLGNDPKIGNDKSTIPVESDPLEKAGNPGKTHHLRFDQRSLLA